ncbi:class V aminotransferase [Vulcanimicrobium alpinum]|uniref:Tritium exchange subunit n=1 Tax=Vulcanimicrobium alpinum TaxID=3016050 RepID=A0AAN1XYT8_UNVUL|nr:alanine--glyoxylate aminotransferase family protein [Vulcanimicrobium alpinum]BDE07880.1 class V aminotransferase [Vulcanimicrobium alpinum]
MSKSLLFIPGPVTVAEPVLTATAQPMIDHRGPEFKALLERVARRMKPIFGTERAEVLLLGSSGTGGLEAAVANMFGAGDRILACPIGVFGERLIAIARTFGCDVDVLETAWGSGVDPQALRAKLESAAGERRYAGILLTHNETSTGSQNDLASLAAAIRGCGAYVVVDSVSGLAASDFRMDEWGFDIVVTASQKALAVPPGLAMVAVAPRAWERMDSNRAPRYYFDLKKARDFAALGQTPWTPPVSIVYGLDAALDEFERTGPRRVWERHARYARAIRACAEALGLEIFSAEGAHSVTVVAIRVPAGIDADAIRKRLRDDRGVVIGGGQGKLKGQIIRIGTMGDLSQTDVLGALGALEIALLDAGVSLHIGSGVQAALRVFLETEAPAAV